MPSRIPPVTERAQAEHPNVLFNDYRGSDRVFNAYTAAMRDMMSLTQVAVMEMSLFTPGGNLSAAPVFNQYVKNLSNSIEDIEVISCEREIRAFKQFWKTEGQVISEDGLKLC